MDARTKRVSELVDLAMSNTNDIADRISATMDGENLITCFGALSLISSSVLEHMLDTGGDNVYMHSICASGVAAHLGLLVDVCDKHGISLENELKLVRKTITDAPM